MTIHVVGGIYREFCEHPRWNEIFGSAGRAAIAVATIGTPVVLHSYFDAEAQDILTEKAVWLDALQLIPTKATGIVRFDYLHDMAIPEISGVPAQPYPSLLVEEQNVVRFGMLEGDAIVHADWAVYDPQNVGNVEAFGANGSTARHLALVLNSQEAAQMAGMTNAHASQSAPALGSQHSAEVVVVKMGPEGAFVWTTSGTAQVPAFRTERVWKIGSGDCFVAHFADAWISQRKTATDAAVTASRATAFYCETQGFPDRDALHEIRYPAVELGRAYHEGVRRKAYLAGPFFDLAQVWMVKQARKNLRGLGLDVFSPYHDVGLGSANDVVQKDLDAIKECDLVLALTDGLDAGTIYEIGYARALKKPVVVYSERHQGENLKMMSGSGCIICPNYTTALYSTLWEALKL